MPSNRFMSSHAKLSMFWFFIVPLFSASTVIFPRNFTLFSLTSWYFLAIGKIFGFLIFFLPLIFQSTNFCELLFLCTIMACQLPAGHWLGFQFGALQYLQFRYFGLFFGLVPSFPVNVILCKGSFLISSFRFDISVSSIVFFLFFLSHVFCCICLTFFSTTESFSVNNLSCNFLSVVEVIKFDMSNSVLKYGKSDSFSNWNNCSQCCFGVFVWFFRPVEILSSFAIVSFRRAISVI